MSNSTEAVNSTENKSQLTVAFQPFNGVVLAKISNNKGRETYAYGATKELAEQNALRNYQIKYSTLGA